MDVTSPNGKHPVCSPPAPVTVPHPNCFTFRHPNLVITIIPADNLAHNDARPRNRNMIPCEFLWLQWISYIFVNQMTSFKMADEMRRTHVLLGCVTTYIRVTLVHESIQGFQGLPNRHLGVVELAPMRFLKRKYIF